MDMVRDGTSVCSRLGHFECFGCPRAGSFVTGVVLLDLETPLALSSVAIKLKGRAVTHFTVPRTVSNGKSSHTGECVLECVLPSLSDNHWDGAVCPPITCVYFSLCWAVHYPENAKLSVSWLVGLRGQVHVGFHSQRVRMHARFVLPRGRCWT